MAAVVFCLSNGQTLILLKTFAAQTPPLLLHDVDTVAGNANKALHKHTDAQKLPRQPKVCAS